MLALGGILTPANTALIPDELGQQLAVSSSKILFCSVNLLPTAKAAFQARRRDADANLQHLVVIGEYESSPDVVPLSTLLSDDGAGFTAPPAIDTANDVAFLPYSSGTTGIPKGVMMTHKNVLANQVQLFEPLYATIHPG